MMVILQKKFHRLEKIAATLVFTGLWRFFSFIQNLRGSFSLMVSAMSVRLNSLKRGRKQGGSRPRS